MVGPQIAASVLCSSIHVVWESDADRQQAGPLQGCIGTARSMDELPCGSGKVEKHGRVVPFGFLCARIGDPV